MFKAFSSMPNDVYKIKSTTGWSDPPGNGDNSLGLNIVPSGFYFNGSFYSIGIYANFWTAAPGSDSMALKCAIYNNLSCGYYYKDAGYALRLGYKLD